MNHRDTEAQRETQRIPIPSAINEASSVIINAALQLHPDENKNGIIRMAIRNISVRLCASVVPPPAGQGKTLE